MTAPTAEALEQRAREVLDACDMGTGSTVWFADAVAAMLVFAAEQVAAGVAAERERAAGICEQIANHWSERARLETNQTRAELRTAVAESHLLNAAAIRQEPPQ